MDSIDSAILADFNRGDAKAFNFIFKAYYRQLCYFSYKFMGDRDEAEEIVLDVFYELFKRYELFKTTKSIKAFLYVSARNACLNALKAKKRYEARLETFAKFANDTDLEYEQMRGEILLDIYKAANKLPGKCKEVFFKLFQEGLQPSEVADQLGISLNNVYNHKRNALESLRLKLLDTIPMLLLLLLLEPLHG